METSFRRWRRPAPAGRRPAARRLKKINRAARGGGSARGGAVEQAAPRISCGNDSAAAGSLHQFRQRGRGDIMAARGFLSLAARIQNPAPPPAFADDAGRYSVFRHIVERDGQAPVSNAVPFTSVLLI